MRAPRGQRPPALPLFTAQWSPPARWEKRAFAKQVHPPPRVPVPGARPRRPPPVPRPGAGGPESRSPPELRRPPGKRSPTFSGQEEGRPRAFPVVQLNRAETSLHSHSLGCQPTGGQSSAPSRAGGAGQTRGGGRGSPVRGGRPHWPRGAAPAFAAMGVALPPRGPPAWRLGRSAQVTARWPLGPRSFPRRPGKTRVSRCLEDALSLHTFLSLIFNVISPKGTLFIFFPPH